VVRPPYRATLRLYWIAAEHWVAIDGGSPGVDLIRLPPDRFLNYIQHWVLERTPPEKREEWLMLLNAPLPHETKEKPKPKDLMTAEESGFMDLHRSRGA
jgi:hypothetical protein